MKENILMGFGICIMAAIGALVFNLSTDTASAQINVTADGIALTEEETMALLAAEAARNDGMAGTRAKAQAFVNWLDNESAIVLDAMNLSEAQRAAQEEKVASARALVIQLAKKRIEMFRDSVPDGVEIRRSRLEYELAEAQKLVLTEQARLDALENPDPDILAARQEALAIAQQAETDAQAALNAFNISNP